MRYLNIRKVCDRTGLSRSTIWRLERDGRFPKRVKLSPGRTAHVEAEIEGWIIARAAERVGGDDE